jgi:hypothetical protein
MSTTFLGRKIVRELAPCLHLTRAHVRYDKKAGWNSQYTAQHSVALRFLSEFLEIVPIDKPFLLPTSGQSPPGAAKGQYAESISAGLARSTARQG